MKRCAFSISLPLSDSLYFFLRKILKKPELPSRNYVGARSVEWGFVAENIPEKKQSSALDFGFSGDLVSAALLQKNYSVDIIDLEPEPRHFVEGEKRHYIQADLLKTDSLPQYDLIINCSTVEHVGLQGRYGVSVPVEDGDMQAMRKLHSLLKEDGVMLLTVPTGRDRILSPCLRAYGPARLPELLSGFAVEKECYWIKNDENRWIMTSREEALNEDSIAGGFVEEYTRTGLACFVLHKKSI